MGTEMISYKKLFLGFYTIILMYNVVVCQQQQHSQRKQINLNVNGNHQLQQTDQQQLDQLTQQIQRLQEMRQQLLQENQNTDQIYFGDTHTDSPEDVLKKRRADLLNSQQYMHPILQPQEQYIGMEQSVSHNTETPIRNVSSILNNINFNNNDNDNNDRKPIAFTPLSAGRPSNNQFDTNNVPTIHYTFTRPTIPTIRPNRIAPNPQNSQANIFSSYNNDINVHKKVTSFAWKLFKESQLQDQLANYILSPISPQLLLSMLSEVSTGITKNQLDTVIGDISPESINNLITSMQSSITRNNQLEIATAMFVTRDYNLNNTFVTNSRRANIKIVKVNFENSGQISDQINNWAAESTHNQITRIINSGAQLNGVKLLLTNAVYFRGFWKYPFYNTTMGDFYETEYRTIRTNIMKQTAPLRFGEYDLQNNLGFKWVELPYEDENFSMILILPKTRFTLNDVITRGMTTDDFTNFMSQINTTLKKMIILSLPKFSLRSTFGLTNTLKTLGLTNPFTTNSNIPYLAQGEMVRLSDAVQQSVLNVDEKGSVAAAVTTFSVITLSIRPISEETIFNIDEPFISIIIDKQQNIPIFISKIYNP